MPRTPISLSLAAGLAAVALIGCAIAAPTGSPSPSPSPSPTQPGDPTPGPGNAFTLRAWISQALPPRATFGRSPIVVIHDDVVIQPPGAVPAIFPGPLYLEPTRRTITLRGLTILATEADRLGLLSGRADFIDQPIPPGGATGHIEIVLGAQRFLLRGDPMRAIGCEGGACRPQPGSPEAFGTFFQQLQALDGWLGSELGRQTGYVPEELAVLVVAPEPDQGVQPDRIAWPLEVPFAALGAPAATGQDDRCATVRGDDLARLLPVVRGATSITRFRDATGAERSLVVRALTPGEPDPCAPA